ncbi:MAG: aminopeptidase [Bryobacterales bacterium]|nr:aminopeptidase [Bryobacterales bacterium]
MDHMSRRAALTAIAAAAAFSSSCRSSTKAGDNKTKNDTTMTTDAHDVHSFAQPEKVRARSVALDLTVSFEKQNLAGAAIIEIEQAKGADPLILDTRDLSIDKIESSPDGAAYTDVKWTLGQKDPILGSPLSIQIPPLTRFVRIQYQSSPQASGLQWLKPEQTAGKRSPFLFSQNESIHARSWIPIQDSPGVRVAYTARIRVPNELVALMSAEHKGASNGVYDFAMETPIPPYLIALAVGDLKFSEIGPRTGVYAEAPILSKAAWEFSDMEKMVATVEKLYGPYRWGRYDLLILPPSFPFGGMENPRLTFATPTVIAGDKSLAGLVSHELAHSWSGNLVTNATWSDFWLNEGFTSYIENRIQEALYGREQALMEQVLDRRKLDKELTELDKRDQILHIDLKGRDPDEGGTNVPYVKGALLLRQMEEVFGRDRFDDYLKRYFDHFSFQSITTATMLDYLQRELFDKEPALATKIPIHEWIYEPGLPASAPRAVSERLETVRKDAKAFASGAVHAKAIQTKNWSTQEWLEFLEVLPPLKTDQLAELDSAFHLTQTGNSEILDQWLQMAIKADYRPAYPRLESFLLEVGRQKFIKPLYTELMKTLEGQKRARAIYAKARARYHPIAQTAIDKIVK